MRFVVGDPAAEAVEELATLRAAWRAANEYIAASVCDPDTTPRMRAAYAEYLKWRELLAAREL
jgi:hypothetical protein